MNFPRAERADIGLLLEGTFPYVSGGVSSWVNQIIRGFPQYTFALVFIGSRKEDYGDPKYTLPDNVVHLETHYLYNEQTVPQIRPKLGDAKVFGDIKHLHECFRFPQMHKDGKETVQKLIPELSAHGKAGLYTFLYSEEAW
jgi:hypothetical protein